MDHSPTAATVTENIGGPKIFRLYARLRWKQPVTGNPDPNALTPCSGYSGDVCAGCPGICAGILFGEKNAALTPSEIADGYAYVTLVPQEPNNSLIVIPEGEMDNGDGFCRVDGDVQMDSGIAHDLGYQAIQVKEGKYAIYGRSATMPFGKVAFAAVFTH